MAQKFTVPISIRQLTSASSQGLSIRLDGETEDRIRIEAGGRILWGDGTSVTGMDINLYRSGADLLKTDDAFEAAGGLITLTTSGAPTATLGDGAIAIDTTNDTFYFRSNGTWQEVSGGGASVTVSDAAPSSPDPGNLWYESDTGSMFIYYDDGSTSQWVEVGGSSVVAMFTSDTAPTTPSNGDLWFETDTGKTYVYYDDGTSEQWVEVGAAGGGAAASGSDGSIQFATSSELDSSVDLFWDNSNSYLGVGTNTPSRTLDVVGDAYISQNAEVDGILTANHIHGNIAGSLYLHVKNTSGSSISAGTPVYATGSVGASGATEVSPSDASTASTMPALGILQETLAHNAEGHATVLGVIGNLNTSTYAINDSLYVAPGGGLTTTRPTSSTDLVQKIARVIRVDSSTGELLVLGAGRTNDIPNDVTLGTDTIGDYIESISAGTGVTVYNGTGEGASAGIAIGQDVATTANVTFNDLTLTGDLTVNGSTTTVDTATLTVEDPLIILASGNTTTDSVDIGFYGLYDTSGSQDLYAGLFRDATDGKFRLFKDSQTAPTTTVDTAATGYTVASLVANIEGNVTGTVSDISNHSIGDLSDVDLTIVSPATGDILYYDGADWVAQPWTVSNSSDVTITSATAGDYLKWNGSAWVNDAIDLGTDTTGDYVESLVAGTGVSLLNNSGEGATPTIYIGQDVGTNASVTFDHVTGTYGVTTITTTGVPTVSAPDGTIAVDTTNDVFYFISNGTWQEVSGGGASVTVSDTPPSAPDVGNLWFESDTGLTFIYYDDGNTSQWVEVGGAPGIKSTAADAAPSDAIQGDLWYKTDTGNTYIYYDDGTSAQWVEIGATGNNGVTVGTSGPASPTVGELWYNTTLAVMYVWDGSSWLLAGGGGGASVTVSDTPPSSPDEGDMWFESDTGKLLVYYDSVWVEVGGTGGGGSSSSTITSSSTDAAILLMEIGP